MRRAPLFALLCAASGCVPSLQHLRAARALESPLGRVELRAVDEASLDAQRLQVALDRAVEAVGRWGALPDGVTLYLLEDHAQLERVVRRPGYAWLRAWARYDAIYLQAPSTWPGRPATQADLDELVLHELTHCVVYQRASTRGRWEALALPMWFREGMASWTAKQGWRWPSLTDVARELAGLPGADPLRDGERLSKHHERLVYGAAHHAFTFLVRRYGEVGVQRLLDALKQGARFEDAFAQATGVTEADFKADFLNYLRWGGFRGGNGVPLAPAPPP